MDASKLEGAALDGAVAKVARLTAGFSIHVQLKPEINVPDDFWPLVLVDQATGSHVPWRPSTNWEQGGYLIERERIVVLPINFNDKWVAGLLDHPSGVNEWGDGAEVRLAAPWVHGPTPLIAAMRAFCAAKGVK